MVPDISLYAPHIAAVFGRFEPQDPRYIPYSLADHTENRHVSLRLALDWLLNLPDHRLSVSDLMTLLQVDAVRQRFAISTDDLPLLQRWIRHTQIRWGLDEAHRHRFIAQPNAHNTWMQGMRQMLLRYAMRHAPTGREPNHRHEIEPNAERAGLDATMAGSLARLLEKLQQQLIILSETTTPAYWYDRMETMLLDFFDCEDAEDTALLESWLSILLQWRNTCEQVGMQTPLSLPVVREHWLAQLDTTAPTQRFLAGRLTFATLLPMRAIPFRMICLLGLNDGDFPRHRPPRRL
jgi:exodeoxyribonuclease V gamma subunit